jgi:hypothetical protein
MLQIKGEDQHGLCYIDKPQGHQKDHLTQCACPSIASAARRECTSNSRTSDASGQSSARFGQNLMTNRRHLQSFFFFFFNARHDAKEMRLTDARNSRFLQDVAALSLK